MSFVYTQRQPAAGVLHDVVRRHLRTFLALVAARTDGASVPGFVAKELRKFLGCGVLARGFARVRCPDCRFERLVPFSCKSRGVCPSCGGRRMAERAAHLVEHVFPPDVPVRQWVLSVPHRLRYRLAYDHDLCREVVRIWSRVLRVHYRRQARAGGVEAGGGETGMVTGLQRFGDAMNLHVHAHTLVLDGVFAPAAGLGQAAVQGRAALGRRAGRGPMRLGADPHAPWVERAGPWRAHHAGFDVHAGVTVAAHDRAGLEPLCCSVFCPPLGQQRLRRLGDGRVAVALQHPWADGTTHVVFTPLELLERLAVPIPRVPARERGHHRRG